MNRFNAFLAVFAILMIIWLIVDGPPRPPEPSTQSTLSSNISEFDILSDSVRIVAERNAAGEWRGDLPPTIADRVAILIDDMITNFNTLVSIEQVFDDQNNGLAQYGLNANSRRYVISFTEATTQASTFTFVVGNRTTDQQEHYAVFFNPDTASYQGAWVYTVPAVYIERLDELVILLTGSSEQDQTRGQSTEP